ncbi:flotillin family protein [Tuwongella immobilis]|uniref:Band 7 domain-containing protein n=1 Tax=Tuwongella immobilis TaxID=692036 RepID=A0A6C2YJV8_9BACT|nr:flotillin family protein [Tuwongella immobilis]VIP01509.1 Band 7 protein OS=Pirellula staleyi (strain ATCC 27377 / DSM 6068 / ICPB 4128) GN=Psta_1346 PE=4 SV=1: Band_7 [Tuwongella immobilis]VTR98619.1 Band 7 protein OS=Pirellula staleyi (strain ATCC 27377 / DSM 6068 / ICPB 4128) GN=Psta_1346 PE=4 SV=1: Band_7 [Tuwongella immobilis]
MFDLSLFAQTELIPLDKAVIIAGGIAGLLVMSLLIMFVKCYKRCPSNRVLVIFGKTGRNNETLCIHGGAKFVWPVIQDFRFLSLEPIQIEVPLKGALSLEKIRVNVPSVFTVAVGTEPEMMTNAAMRILGLMEDEIKQQAGDMIFGQLRQVIASMRIEDINRDRDKFLDNVQSSLEPELKKIGLKLINVNITDITDESGYIEALGRKAASQALQQANIDVAEQEKLGQIGVADAQREKEISVANANKLRQIGVREASRDQAIRLAEMAKEQSVGEQKAALEQDLLVKEARRQQAIQIAQYDRDQQVGEQQAKFERESAVKEAERAMRIRLAEANAKAVSGEAASQAEIAAAEATLKVKQAEAYQLGETRKREAEAAVQEAANRALARTALAQAERVEAEMRAELEARAKAEKARVIVDAEAEASKRRIEAEAQAAAIYARLEAEAKGQYEMLAKKGDGLQRIIEACGGAQQAFQLLLLEHLDKLAETAATAISNIKFDKVVVWETGGTGAGSGSNTSAFLRNMASVFPPMLQVMKDIGGVQMPEFLAKLVDDSAPSGQPTQAPMVANGPTATTAANGTAKPVSPG